MSTNCPISNVYPGKPHHSEELSDKMFQCLRDFFFEKTGNWLNESKRYLVLYRLSRILGPDKPFKNFNDLCEEVHSNPDGETVKELITLLTTHYSYFFREPEHFTFYQNYLLDTGRHLPEIRVWSAACSTGEEAYSLAIASRMICKENWCRKIKILATDISRESVDKAKTGEYSYAMLKERLPKNILDTYFTKQKDKAVPLPVLKEMIRFRMLNLLAPFPFGKQFQIIFLRNVLYYLDEQSKKTVLDKITMALEPGGYLILGHMDTAEMVRYPYKSEKHNIYWRI